MSQLPAGIHPIRNICEVESVDGPGASPDLAPDLLVEVPHGATRETDYTELRARLHSKLPEDLHAFFFVNTDVGAPECGLEIARRFVASGATPRRALVVRCLVPRTFIDCNRDVDGEADEFRKAELTAAIPEYISDPRDIELLTYRYHAYREVAERAYEWVCGPGGRALTLHTYAPRSVGIRHVDHGIVAALREAYEPERYATWPERPVVDLVTRSSDDRRLAPAALVESILHHLRSAGIPAEENGTYRLDPVSMGYHHSVRYPGRVVCIELRRDHLADPFTPFEEMRISETRVARMAAPIAAAVYNSFR